MLAEPAHGAAGEIKCTMAEYETQEGRNGLDRECGRREDQGVEKTRMREMKRGRGSTYILLSIFIAMSKAATRQGSATPPEMDLAQR